MAAPGRSDRATSSEKRASSRWGVCREAAKKTWGAASRRSHSSSSRDLPTRRRAADGEDAPLPARPHLREEVGEAPQVVVASDEDVR